MKPLNIKNEIDTKVAMVDGLLQITSMRYKSRIRKKQVNELILTVLVDSYRVLVLRIIL
jgi:hypothetical protein